MESRNLVLPFYATTRYTVRYSVMETGVRRYTDEHGNESGSPPSDSGTSCEGTLKWPSSCTGSLRPSPARTR